MLMQLVCVDRRYNRMNCFNIRELQGILKRRFFTDLVNSSDHRDILSSSMIGLRFKTNNSSNLEHDTLSFFKLGTTNSDKFRSSYFVNSYFSNDKRNSFLLSCLQLDISSVTPRSSGFLSIFSFFYSFFYITPFNIMNSLASLFEKSTLSSLILTLKVNFFFVNLPTKNSFSNKSRDLSSDQLFYTSDNTPQNSSSKFFLF